MSVIRITRSCGMVAAAVIVGVACGSVAVVWRATAVDLVPGAARFYAAVGLPAPGPGLAFRRVAAERVGAGAEAALVVEGDIANTSNDAQALPDIQLSVRGPGGQPFYTWTSEPPRRTLPPSETTRFRARLAAPPQEGTQVLVRFASARDGTVAARAP